MTPLQTRIVDLLKQQPKRRMDYHALMGSLWPRDLCPKAWCYSRNGGPPGIAMPFGRALNKLSAAGVLFVDYHNFGREIILRAADANA